MAFALVFRTNVANSRYWEARTQVGLMSSKWGDSAALALSFEEAGIYTVRAERYQRARDAANKAATLAEGTASAGMLAAAGNAASDKASSDADVADKEALRRAQAEIVHRYSLMHALALQYLRRDNEVSNLCDETEADVDGSTFHDGNITFHATGGQVDDVDQYGIAECFPQGLCFSRILRVGKSDEAARVIHEKQCASLRLPVLGGVSGATLAELESHDDRVGFTWSTLLALTNQRRAAGCMLADAPVFSRLQQTLSDGMLGFSQARMRPSRIGGL